MVASEKTTADRIRCRVNRQAVQSSLTSLLEYLKTVFTLPSNGLLLYWSDHPDHRYAVVPTIANHQRVYRCDRKFDTDVFRSLLLQTQDSDSIGLVFGTGDEYGLAVCGPNSTRPRYITRDDVYIRNKQSKGGQSSVRFERLAQESRAKAAVKVVEEMRKHWLDANGRPKLKSIVMAGPDEWRRLVGDRLASDARPLSDIITKRLTSAASNVLEDTCWKALGEATVAVADTRGESLLREWLSKVEMLDRLVFNHDEIGRRLEEGTIEVVLVSSEKKEELGELVNRAGNWYVSEELKEYQGCVGLVYKGVVVGEDDESI